MVKSRLWLSADHYQIKIDIRRSCVRPKTAPGVRCEDNGPE